MPARICVSEVIEVKRLTADVKEISLRLIDPPTVDFKAGQYIAIEITETRDGQQRLNNRPYSIASPPEEQDVIKLCANLVPGGPGSSYLHSLKVGEEVPFIYPLGFFTIKGHEPTSLLFVATGTGIVPIMSMIVHLLRSGSICPMTLLWGLRREEDCYYQDTFEALARQHPSFQYKLTLSQASSRWEGLRGRVTHRIQDEIPSVENLEAYLCGNMGMIKEIRLILLEKGLSKKAIHFEKFYD